MLEPVFCRPVRARFTQAFGLSLVVNAFIPNRQYDPERNTEGNVDEPLPPSFIPESPRSRYHDVRWNVYKLDKIPIFRAGVYRP